MICASIAPHIPMYRLQRIMFHLNWSCHGREDLAAHTKD